MLLTDFNALTFDCYGTLIDWESGMVEALKGLDAIGSQRPLTRNADPRGACTSRVQPAALHTGEAVSGACLPIVYKRLAEEWGVPRRTEDCVGLRPVGRKLAGVRRLRRTRCST